MLGPPSPRKPRARHRGAVAIIGMACRFPGADDPASFWRNLCQGVESIRRFTDDELLASGVEPALLDDPSYVKAAPVLDGIDRFDAAFFGYSPREAAVTDPQHRLFKKLAVFSFRDRLGIRTDQPHIVPG